MGGAVDRSAPAAAARPEATGPGRPGLGGSRSTWSWGVFLIGLLASLLLYRSLWRDPVNSTLGTLDHTNDPMQMMWFLKWVPWQVLHGHNPFVSEAIFYPGGVALSWNTFVPTLGIVAAPLTLATSASLSFAVLITLAPALTALTGFWWLRRHVSRRWTAAGGGLLLAFDPYMSGHLLGHLNLVFTCLLPLMVMLAEDLLWRRPRPQLRTSAFLGVVTAAQLGISEELALILVIGVLVVLALSFAVEPARTSAAVRGAGVGALSAIGMLLVLASPLLVSQLLLAPSVTVDTSRFRAVPADFVQASIRQQFGWGTTTTTSLLGGAEHGVYLGWPVVVVLAVGVLCTFRRDRWVRVATGAAVALVVLCMFPVFQGVPALESVMPARYSFALYLVLAWLLTRWCDRLFTDAPTGFDRRTVTGSIAAAAMAVAVVGLVPRAVGSYPLPAPATFFGSPWQERQLPRGSAVLLLPAGDARGMYYQQQADFSFVQPGGYALRPASGPVSTAPDLLLVALSDEARYAPVVDPARVAAGRRALCDLSLRAVVVTHSAAEHVRLEALATDLLQRPPDHVDGGVSVWLVTCPAGG